MTNQYMEIKIKELEDRVKALEQEPDGRMTSDDAIEELKSDIEWSKLNQYPYIGQRKVKALEMAIQALEQGCKLKENKESDAENLCDSCKTKGCIFQSGIVRSHCDFYKGESEG